VRRVIVYVDGFNLSYGRKERYGNRYLWLDLRKLGLHLLRPDQVLVTVRYFTARVRDDPEKFAQQRAYLGALRCQPGIDIIFGRFQAKKVRCRCCGSEWTSHEEKKTDVSIAVALLEDGIADRFDTAILVSADSDLCPAVQALGRQRPEARMIAAFPPARHSEELRMSCQAAFTLGEANLRQSQLPQVVERDSATYARPAAWK
jgi:Uncharacterized conserved protein